MCVNFWIESILGWLVQLIIFLSIKSSSCSVSTRKSWLVFIIKLRIIQALPGKIRHHRHLNTQLKSILGALLLRTLNKTKANLIKYLFSLRRFSNTISKQVTKHLDYFAFNCYQTNKSRCLRYSCVVEFGEFPKDHFIKSNPWLFCISLK